MTLEIFACVLVAVSVASSLLGGAFDRIMTRRVLRERLILAEHVRDRAEAAVTGAEPGYALTEAMEEFYVATVRAEEVRGICQVFGVTEKAVSKWKVKAESRRFIHDDRDSQTPPRCRHIIALFVQGGGGTGGGLWA
jgi:hypothetical protein